MQQQRQTIGQKEKTTTKKSTVVHYYFLPSSMSSQSIINIIHSSFCVGFGVKGTSIDQKQEISKEFL